MRSSQVFSITGLPEGKVEKAKTPKGRPQYRADFLRALEKNVLVKRDGTGRIVQHQQTLAAPGT